MNNVWSTKIVDNEHDCFNDNKENRRTSVQNQIKSNKLNLENLEII